jgi:hypothetical protein
VNKSRGSLSREASRRPSATLATALRRFTRAIVPTVGYDQEAPPPETDWQRATELRLRALEQATNAQNRLLLLTLISIAAEFLYGLRTP